MPVIISITKQGNELAKKISQHFTDCDCYTLEKWNDPEFLKIEGKLKDFCGFLFGKYSMIIFIMATGIVVRSIAHLLQTKQTDPAIVVIDELGLNVISLLSGHLGGANQLSLYIADKIGANPVITTASDINNLPSIDMLALKHKLIIDSMENAKTLTSFIVNKQAIAIIDEHSMLPQLNIKKDNINYEGTVVVTNNKIYTSEKPFVKLIPKNITIGIGCRKAVEPKLMIDFITETCENLNIDTRSIKTISSISIKSEEQAILKAAEHFKTNIEFHSKQVLHTVDDMFIGSDFVKNTVGVASVSASCAFISGGKSGKFLIEKSIKNGMTISVFQFSNNIC